MILCFSYYVKRLFSCDIKIQIVKASLSLSLLTLAIFALNGVAPEPILAVCAPGASRVIQTKLALSSETVAGARILHVDVATTAAWFARAAYLTWVAIETRGTAEKT
jgi:hypothetical protein